MIRTMRTTSSRAARRTGASAGGSAQRINLGCGSRWTDGWTNVDAGIWTRLLPLRGLLPNRLVPAAVRAYPPTLKRWDLRRVPLPFADGSATYIFSQYVLEYLTPQEALAVLRDCRRVLAPGGLLRVCQTDVEAIAHKYLASKPTTGLEALERTRLFARQAAPEHTKLSVRLFRRGGVQQLFDVPSLEWMLGVAGFVDVQRRAIHDGDCPDLDALEAEWDPPLIRYEARVPQTIDLITPSQ